MDVCAFSPHSFSVIRITLTLIGMLGSLAYIGVLKHTGLKNTFCCGAGIHILYTLGIGWLLASSNLKYPYALLLFAAFQVLSSDFISPVGMLKAISFSKEREGVALSFFALTRNIVSTVFSFLAVFCFEGTFYPVLLINLILSCLILILLFFMYRYLEQRA